MSTLYEITRKTRSSVRIKPYGSTNRAAVCNYSREFFDSHFIDRKDGTAIERQGETLVELHKQGKL